MSLLVSISCKEDKESDSNKSIDNILYYNEFPKTKSVTGNDINEIEQEIFPIGIGIHNDIIVFCDSQQDTHFYVYKLPEFKYLGSFGNEGVGPSDIENPIFWGQIEDKNGAQNISVYLSNKMKFISFDLKKAIESPLNYEDFQVTYMPPETNDAVNILQLNTNKFVGGGFSDQGDLFIYDKSSDELIWKNFSGEKKFIDHLKSKELLEEYKRGVIKIKPDKSRIVKVYNYSSEINVFGKEGDLIFSIKNSKDLKPKILSIGAFDRESKLYYNNLYLSDSFIYCLNLNCSINDYISNKCNNVSVDVFDWEGNPISKIILNEGIGPLSPFVVDEKNNKIYTVNPKSESSYFSTFDLK